jgi:hypothetical protein
MDQVFRHLETDESAAIYSPFSRTHKLAFDPSTSGILDMLGMMYSSIFRWGRDPDWGPLRHEHMHSPEPPMIKLAKVSACFISSFHFRECSFPEVIPLSSKMGSGNCNKVFLPAFLSQIFFHDFNPLRKIPVSL